MIDLEKVEVVPDVNNTFGIFMMNRQESFIDFEVKYADFIAKYRQVAKYELDYGVCCGELVIGQGKNWYFLRDVAKAGKILTMLIDEDDFIIYFPNRFAPLILRSYKGIRDYFALISPIEEDIIEKGGVKVLEMDEDFQVDVGGVMVKLEDLWEGRMW